MLGMRIISLAMAVLFLTALVNQQVEAGKIKKLIAASVIAGALKPRFVPVPIPIPFKLKIHKGDKVVPYPVYSHSFSQEAHYEGGGGYGGGGFGDGGYGGGGFGGGGSYGGGSEWW
ncbi:prismalin-14-like [Stegodyphus dumicola]|uniref:prismalin-14-like n=1 Tax=Stegodyphus dumicola TaxID=202533 RepID=UPI0015B0B9DA|nr:prismalin-14-like [Stegodyphus dumicola]XP_035211676.1 prismalin-14-like [Stegodyphus dumicola]